MKERTKSFLICEGCGNGFTAYRNDARTCGGKCRTALYRREKVAKRVFGSGIKKKKSAKHQVKKKPKKLAKALAGR